MRREPSMGARPVENGRPRGLKRSFAACRSARTRRRGVHWRASLRQEKRVEGGSCARVRRPRGAALRGGRDAGAWARRSAREDRGERRELHRRAAARGRYKPPVFPFTLGSEAAGTVTAVGPDVRDVRVGDRVAYTMIVGTYAEYAIAPAHRLVTVPADVTLESAAAIMLQGTTAHYLTHSTFPIKAGDTALVHAAAGGAGQLVTRIARLRGATVYGTVGSEAKAALAREAGAAVAIDYTRQDFEAEIKKLTNGRGVDV